MPHSPRNIFKSIWSIALTWGVETGAITGVFDGMSEQDTQELEVYLNSVKGSANHPVSILAFLAETLGAYYTEMRQDLELELFTLERELGITRGVSGFEGWGWGPVVFREYTKKCNRLNMGPVYLERRFSFLTSFERWLLDTLLLIDKEVSVFGTVPPVFYSISRSVSETLQNSLGVVTSELHQTTCLQKRAQMLTSTVSLSEPPLSAPPRLNEDFERTAQHNYHPNRQSHEP